MGTINRQMDNMGDAVNDINNIFTTGYKSKEVTFHETVNGLKAIKRRMQDDGVAKKTNRELDFSLQGKGFFEVQLPDGTMAYTRDGAFSIGPNGELVSSQGYPVVVNNPDAEFIAQSYDASSGEVTSDFDVGVNSSKTFIPIGATVLLEDDGMLRTDSGQLIGKLSVVNFTNPDGLIDLGDNLFLATDAVGKIADANIGPLNGQTEIMQGYLESSNVSIVKNMSDMVQMNTAVKAEMKVIKMLDSMQENLNSTITRNL
ncbi:MAG: flagellar hook-basal body complex protein [Candidatus Caenarcaniphilales bacterium]|nr:flagellar hook-basal body complex protein [Candidatus Caenarcaniphilales bacterium]